MIETKNSSSNKTYETGAITYSLPCPALLNRGLEVRILNKIKKE